MQPDSSLAQVPSQSSAHSSAHPSAHASGNASAHVQAHSHSHEHGHSHSHTEKQVTDLKSAVLIGVVQRLSWMAALLAGLWFVVLWALRTHG